MPSFPKDILFSGGELTSEDALDSLLWETCAPARIASGAGFSFDATPFSRLPIRPLSPRSFLPQVFPCAPLHDRKDSSACSEATREKGGRRWDASCRAPRKRETTLVVVVEIVPGRELVFSPAIHISRHESTDRYRRGPLRKNDSSPFDSRRVRRPAECFIYRGYLRLAFTIDKWLDLLAIILKHISRVIYCGKLFQVRCSNSINSSEIHLNFLFVSLMKRYYYCHMTIHCIVCPKLLKYPSESYSYLYN